MTIEEKLINLELAENRFILILQSVQGLPPHPYYKNAIFYKLGDDVVFQYNKENGYFGINSSLVWSVFEKEFGFNHDEIQSFTKRILEEYYNLNNLIPKQLNEVVFSLLERYYKLKS